MKLNYYPGGMLEPGRSYSSSSYRYGFNGKENDNEVKGVGNQQDYGMRIYDPRIVRWLSVDPMFQKQPDQSVYKAFNNNPIIFIDPDGGTEFETVVMVNAKTGKTSMPITRVTSTKLFPKEVMVASSAFGISTHGETKNWDWYDKQKITTVTVDDDGNEISRTTTVQLIGKPVRTSIKSQRWAQIVKYGFATGIKGEGGTQPGGWNLVTGKNSVDATKFVALKGAETINIDLIVLGLKSMTKSLDPPDFWSDGTTKAADKLKSFIEQAVKMAKGSSQKEFSQCESCQSYKSNKTGNVISDTTGKGINETNTEKVPLEKFHE